MVFNLSQEVYFAVVLIFLLWLTLLSFFVYRIISHHRHLTKGVTKGDLKTVLEKILGKTDLSEKKIEELIKRCQALEDEDHFPFKKIGILRFNPFKDTGGNQSFILALLNADDDGLILSSLYSRTGNRWYIKGVKKGKGVELDLSKEEKEAVKKAQ